MFILFRHCTNFSNASQNMIVNPRPIIATEPTVFATDKNRFFSEMAGLPQLFFCIFKTFSNIVDRLELSDRVLLHRSLLQDKRLNLRLT